MRTFNMKIAKLAQRILANQQRISCWAPADYGPRRYAEVTAYLSTDRAWKFSFFENLIVLGMMGPMS